MKLFPALLAASLVAAAAAPAEASNNNNGNGCRNRCGDTSTTNQGGQGGRGGRGGQGGQGGSASANAGAVAVGVGVGQGGAGGDATIERGAVRTRNRNENENTNRNRNRNRNENTVIGGDQRNVVRDSGNSENTNRNRATARGGDQEQALAQRQAQSQSNSQSQSSSSTSSANNAGNNQNITIQGDMPEAAVAPLPNAGAPGQIGDIVVPLPNVSAGAFGSGADYGNYYGDGNRYDYGVSVGVNIPLGAGRFRAAAEEEIAARADRNAFRLLQEAIWLRDNGVLNQEAHPRHWEALYGATTAEKFTF